ncbi:A1 cistron-splicing factor [Melampsora americana]|nr:A1 cistron-splicing factor [Melampsora americana]
MNYENLSSIELQKFYNSAGFFILNNLPISTQFSIDGHSSLTGPRFQGLKLIPSGFHLITFVPGPRKNNDTSSQNINQSNHISQQIKHGIIRFFKPQEIIIRSYDESKERIQESTDQEPETISSIDHMKSIDSGLAPYPIERYPRWKSLTSHIQPNLVEEVFGFDSRDDVILDSLMCNEESEQINLTHHTRHISDSYPRDPNSNLFNKNLKQTNQIKSNELNEKFTTWPKINLKRSWPKDSIGEELTKWSRDKSWLFNQFIIHECQKDLNKFLGLIQLSFLTFLQVHSFQSLDTYQSLLNLLTKSTVKELMTFNPNYQSLIIETVVQLINQLKELETDFFIELQDPQLENWFFKMFNLFRTHLNQILNHENQEFIKHQWVTLQRDCKRFDWNIQDLKKNGNEVESDEDEDESDESDEDEDERPVIVEI